ncbi:MAG: hypothetical protein JW915_03860 [Chitinispirillaceae bacterium]|nr:hypothetical protein [Chitinispirillaceae bacterium]
MGDDVGKKFEFDYLIMGSGFVPMVVRLIRTVRCIRKFVGGGDCLGSKRLFLITVPRVAIVRLGG